MADSKEILMTEPTYTPSRGTMHALKTGLENTQQGVAQTKWLFIAVSFTLIALLGANFGLTLAATKHVWDSHESEGRLVDTTGQTMKTMTDHKTENVGSQMRALLISENPDYVVDFLAKTNFIAVPTSDNEVITMKVAHTKFANEPRTISLVAGSGLKVDFALGDDDEKLVQGNLVDVDGTATDISAYLNPHHETGRKLVWIRILIGGLIDILTGGGDPCCCSCYGNQNCAIFCCDSGCYMAGRGDMETERTSAAIDA